jgi:hypothetical protein
MNQPNWGYMGLFGLISEEGEVRNWLVDAKITGMTYVGVLAGYNKVR